MRPLPALAALLLPCLLASLPGAAATAKEEPSTPRLERTSVLGGGGGEPFEAAGSGGALLVGVRTTTIVWAGHEIVRSIQPLYLGDGEATPGPVFGHPNGEVLETVAKPGYAVGGLLLRWGQRVDAVRLLFLRIGKGQLCPYDGYSSPWIGGEGGHTEFLLGGGRGIAGVLGRAGADLDALGLLERPFSEDHVALTFSGRIDGSEKIVIDAKEARWQNVFWGTSGGTFALGGIPWTPRKTPVLANHGRTAYLPGMVDFSTARLVKTRGRDAVTIEPDATSVTVRIADNPNGAGLYEFTIVFERWHPPAQLSVHARIDGSDEIVITKEKATWHHVLWGWPSGNVFLNDVAWDPRREPEIRNDATSRYLPQDVDFRTAQVLAHRGRDLAAVEVHEDRLLIHFVDTPIGSDEYEVVIAFGRHEPFARGAEEGP